MGVDDDVILQLGELLAEIWTPKFSAGGAVLGVTRTHQQGLNGTHVREVRAIAVNLDTDDLNLITKVLLQSHGQPGSPAAVRQWKPHVAKALKEKMR